MRLALCTTLIVLSFAMALPVLAALLAREAPPDRRGRMRASTRRQQPGVCCAPGAWMDDAPALLDVPDPTTTELRLQLAQAQAALRARDDFLATAAHELRSPLNALALRLAAIERMAQRAGQPALQQELQRARRGVDRYVARAVVLLDVSRMNTDGLQITPARVRTADLVADVVDAYRDEARFRGATLEGEDLVDATGLWDAHMLEQILGNLVSNAIKYGQGTPVRVRATADGPGRVCFEVSDEGPGIAESDRRRIFERFERVVSTARDRAGFGIGLWLVGRMVAAHRGQIEVISPPGAGAVFQVRLPLECTTGKTEVEGQP